MDTGAAENTDSKVQMSPIAMRRAFFENACKRKESEIPVLLGPRASPRRRKSLQEPAGESNDQRSVSPTDNSECGGVGGEAEDRNERSEDKAQLKNADVRDGSKVSVSKIPSPRTWTKPKNPPSPGNTTPTAQKSYVPSSSPKTRATIVGRRTAIPSPVSRTLSGGSPAKNRRDSLSSNNNDQSPLLGSPVKKWQKKSNSVAEEENMLPSPVLGSPGKKWQKKSNSVAEEENMLAPLMPMPFINSDGENKVSKDQDDSLGNATKTTETVMVADSEVPAYEDDCKLTANVPAAAPNDPIVENILELAGTVESDSGLLNATSDGSCVQPMNSPFIETTPEKQRENNTFSEITDELYVPAHEDSQASNDENSAMLKLADQDKPHQMDEKQVELANYPVMTGSGDVDNKDRLNQVESDASNQKNSEQQLGQVESLRVAVVVASDGDNDNEVIDGAEWTKGETSISDNKNQNPDERREENFEETRSSASQDNVDHLESAQENGMLLQAAEEKCNFIPNDFEPMVLSSAESPVIELSKDQEQKIGDEVEIARVGTCDSYVFDPQLNQSFAEAGPPIAAGYHSSSSQAHDLEVVPNKSSEDDVEIARVGTCDFSVVALEDKPTFVADGLSQITRENQDEIVYPCNQEESGIAVVSGNEINCATELAESVPGFEGQDVQETCGCEPDLDSDFGQATNSYTMAEAKTTTDEPTDKKECVISTTEQIEFVEHSLEFNSVPASCGDDESESCAATATIGEEILQMDSTMRAFQLLSGEVPIPTKANPEPSNETETHEIRMILHLDTEEGTNSGTPSEIESGENLVTETDWQNEDTLDPERLRSYGTEEVEENEAEIITLLEKVLVGSKSSENDDESFQAIYGDLLKNTSVDYGTAIESVNVPPTQPYSGGERNGLSLSEDNLMETVSATTLGKTEGPVLVRNFVKRQGSRQDNISEASEITQRARRTAQKLKELREIVRPYVSETNSGLTEEELFVKRTMIKIEKEKAADDDDNTNLVVEGQASVSSSLAPPPSFCDAEFVPNRTPERFNQVSVSSSLAPPPSFCDAEFVPKSTPERSCPENFSESKVSSDSVIVVLPVEPNNAPRPYEQLFSELTTSNHGQVHQDAKAESKPLETENQEPKAESKPLETENQAPTAESKPLETENQEPKAESKPLETKNQKAKAESKPLEAVNQEAKTQLKPLPEVKPLATGNQNKTLEVLEDREPEGEDRTEEGVTRVYCSNEEFADLILSPTKVQQYLEEYEDISCASAPDKKSVRDIPVFHDENPSAHVGQLKSIPETSDHCLTNVALSKDETDLVQMIANGDQSRCLDNCSIM